MSKQLYIILILFSAYFVPAKAQNGLDVVYDFCTDTPVSSVLYSCYADSNQYFVNGVSTTLGISTLHGTLASFDYSGNLLWYKKLLFPGKYNSSQGYKSIIKIEQNKYTIIGVIEDYKIDSPKTVWHPYFYTFTSNGDSIRYTEYIDSTDFRYFTSVLYHDNHLITVGLRETYPNRTLWICKYDTSGILIWQKQYLKHSLTTLDDATIILSADKQHYLIAGKMYDTSTGALSSCIVKVDTAGNLTWMKSLKKKYYSTENWVDVVSNPSGGYYFISTYLKLPTDSPYAAHIYYGKLDEQGDTVWTKTYQGLFLNCEGYKLQWTPDKKHLVLLTGPYSGTSAGAMKIDTSGNIIWTRLYKHVFPTTPQYNGGILRSLSIASDNRYLMAGSTSGYLSWMILTDSNGCRYPNDSACMPNSVKNINTIASEIKIYPNPVTDKLVIENAEKGAKMRILDMIGKGVYNSIISSAKQEIDLSSLVRGNYIVELINLKGDREIRKILKE